MHLARPQYDVAILGSGIGGSMLACILAKHGVSVLLLEESVHPRFTIGESLIPETGVRLRILGEKHGVPEIGWLGSFHALRDNVSSNCGVKRAFSFMYHREGEAHRPDEVNQLPTLTPPFGPDAHLFRQDTDAWLAAIAVRYGATFRQSVRVTEAKLDADGVRLVTAQGESIHAAYLVDAGGMRSLLSTQLGLRDEAPRFRTDTRTLYNHFVGLKPADHLFGDAGHGLPTPLGSSTMHHVFDGGWMWIIPFSNHRDATNPLTSVGVMLDRRKHPVPRGAPADEFKSLLARFPTIGRHFSTATAVRPWVGSGRLQYSQQTLVGPRFLQLPHAAAFVDPLYSSGMSVLTVAVDLIAEALLPACATGDFARERFERMESVVLGAFDHYDRVVSTSFDAFASYDLWNAWNRNWAMGNFLGTFGPLAALVRYLHTGDKQHLHRSIGPGRIGVLSSHLPAVRTAMDASAADIAAAVAGRVPHAEASRAIFARLGALPFLPSYMGFGRPEQHAPSTFTLPSGARHVLWYRRNAEAEWRDYVDFPLTTYAREVGGFAVDQLGAGLRRASHALRDVFTGSHDDWRHLPNALGGARELPLAEAARDVSPDEQAAK